MQDMEYMTIGNCLDYIDRIIEKQEPKNEVRKANQSDFDNF